MTHPPAADPGLMIVLDRQRRLSAEDYHRMIDAGILDEDDRVELIEGVIVEMSPQGPKHAKLIRRLCDPTFARAPKEYIVLCQLPLTLAPDSEPEPDVSVVLRADAASDTSHPTTAALVFEVAGDSLRKDRLAKAALYSGAGIPEYVIVNVEQDCLEVYRGPDAASRRYRSLATLSGDDRFESAAVPDFGFRVSSLFEQTDTQLEQRGQQDHVERVHDDGGGRRTFVFSYLPEDVAAGGYTLRIGLSAPA